MLLTLAVRRESVRATLKTNKLGMQWLRAFSIVGSLSFLFYSLTFLPLADATVVSFLAPLIIVALAGPTLGEAVGWKRWTAVVTGMIGALLVIRPGTDVFQWAALLPLVSAVCFAVFNLATRAIGAADSIYTSLLYTAAGSTLILCAAIPWVWQTPTPLQWAITLAFGAVGLVAHLLIARAIQLAPVSTVAPLNYVRLIWAISIGYFWFGNIPDAWSALGGTIIVGSGLFIVYQELEPNRETTP